MQKRKRTFFNKQNGIGNRLGLCLYKAVLAVTMLFCLFMFWGTMIMAHDKVFKELFSSGTRFIFPLLLAGILCALLSLLYFFYNRFSQKQLILTSVLLFLIMLSILAVILGNFRSTPYSDALNIQDGAMYLARTGDRPLSPASPYAAYFGRYANNYFITLLLSRFFMLLERLGLQDTTLPLLLISAGGVMTGTLFLYLTGVRIGGLRGGVKILTLCVLNPIYYIMVLWVYTNVLSIPFMAAVIYFGIRVHQERRRGKRILYCLLEAATGVTGYFIRPTTAIPIIALVICSTLWGVRKKQYFRKFLQCALLCVIVGGLFFRVISQWNNSYFNTVSDNTYPITHWIMLGSHGDGTHNKEDVRYTGSFETKEEKTEATIQKIVENYSSYSFSDLVSFLHEKLIFSWSVGDNGELINKAAQDTKQTRLYSWVLGDRKSLLQSYCYAFRLITFLLILVCLYHLSSQKGMDGYQFLFILTFLGGILFYCFWEVKGSYSAPFVSIMLLISARGGDVLSEALIKAPEKAEKKKSSPALLSILAWALCVCIMSYQGMVHTEITHKSWSVRSCGDTSQQNIKNAEENSVVEQVFYAEKPFTMIHIRAEADETARETNCGYQVTLSDENGTALYSGEMYADQIKENGDVLIPTGKIAPESRQGYSLRLMCGPNSQGVIHFKERTNSYIDLFEGTLSVDGNPRMNDLWLQVYDEYKAPWCSPKTALLINGGLFILTLILFLGIGRVNKTNKNKSQEEE